MPDNVVDLDVLRPKPVKMKLGGNVIDISFMPSGIVFDVDEVQKELEALALNPDELSKPDSELTPEEIKRNREVGEKGFALTLKLCSLFCSVKFPEMTVAWFRENTEPGQVDILANAIKDALSRSYEGSEAYQKNQEAVRVTSD